MTLTAEITATENATVTQLSGIKPIKTRKQRAPKHDFKNGEGRVFAHRHANGNGWVADTAKVEDSVYVGARAGVYNFARVSGAVRLEGRSKIYGHANVSGHVILKQQASIFGRAVVKDRVQISGSAQISGGAFVGGDSLIYDTFIVTDHAHVLGCRLMGSGNIGGDCVVLRSAITGPVRVVGSANLSSATVNGNVRIDSNARIFNSTINLSTTDEHRVHVTNSAVLANNTYIYAPMEIKDAVVIQGCTFYVRDWRQNEPIRLTNQVLIVQSTFNVYSELTAFLTAAGRRGNRTDAAINAAAGWNAPATVPATVLSPAARRVMRVS